MVSMCLAIVGCALVSAQGSMPPPRQEVDLVERWIYGAIHRFSEGGLISGFEHFPFRYQEKDLPGRPRTQSKMAVAGAAAAAYSKLKEMAQEFEADIAKLDCQIDLLPVGSHGGDDIDAEVIDSLERLRVANRRFLELEHEVRALLHMADDLKEELASHGIATSEIGCLAAKLLPLRCPAPPPPKTKQKPNTTSWAVMWTKRM